MFFICHECEKKILKNYISKISEVFNFNKDVKNEKILELIEKEIKVNKNV